MSPMGLYNILGNKKMQAWKTSTPLPTSTNREWRHVLSLELIGSAVCQCAWTRRHAEDKDLSAYSKTIEYIKLDSAL